jgi:hypothetical protein
MKASNEKRALCIEDFLSLSVVHLSVVFTFFTRVLAGPGYTGAPNQGAMFVFFVLIAFIWPVIAFFWFGGLGVFLSQSGCFRFLLAAFPRSQVLCRFRFGMD